MSRSYDVQGVIHSIGETTEYGNNGFTKREFVIKVTGEDENPAYPNHVALELIKDKCAIMDNYKIGDEIQVQFNLSGRLWSGGGRPEKCFTSLQAWRINSASDQPAGGDSFSGGPPESPPDDDNYDDVPF